MQPTEEELALSRTGMDLVFEIKLRVSVVQSILLYIRSETFKQLQSWWWSISDAKQFKNFKKRNSKKPRDFSTRSQGFSITQKKTSLHHDSLWEETGKGHFRFQKLCFALGLCTILLQSPHRWCARIQWFFYSVALHAWAASWLKETLMLQVASPFNYGTYSVHTTNFPNSIMTKSYRSYLRFDQNIKNRMMTYDDIVLHVFARTAGQWPFICHAKL